MARNSGTGVPDPVYDLTSVLYHALQGADIYAKYTKDAGADEELAAFFREAGEQNERHLIARHTALALPAAVAVALPLLICLSLAIWEWRRQGSQDLE